MSTRSKCGFDHDDHHPETVVSELGHLGGRFGTASAPHLRSVGLLVERPPSVVTTGVCVSGSRCLLRPDGSVVFWNLVEDRLSFATIYQDPRDTLG
ncbi:MAG: hypothetical protein ACP5P1_12655 [Acidimicrobiales bacterium]